jgi:diguanylate cyclase (GGDEF)-like protein
VERSPSTSSSGVSARPRAAAVSRVPVPLAGIWLLLAGYLIGLIRHGPGFSSWVDGVLGVLVEAVPAALCWAALRSAGERRREILALSLALTAFALGDLVYVVDVARGLPDLFPSAGDVGFLAFYPLALTALALAVRRELREAGGTVWLDSLLGGLGAAAVLAVVLERVVAQVTGHPIAGGLALVYPIFDLILVAAVVGIIAVQGRQVRPYWLWMLAGLLTFATVDIATSLSLARDSYALGGWPDVLWPTAMLLVSLWARARPTSDPQVRQPVALLMPGIASTASLAVLVLSSQIRVSTLAVGLAALTVVATAGRTQLAFRQLRRLADLRRQATTDELTALPNRRAFYAHAEAQLAGPEPDLALLLLDLDRFKEVNDSLGHPVGDELLVQIGLRLAEQLREGDVLARLGGDEFAVLLSHTGRAEAIELALKLRAAVAIPYTLEGIALRTDVSIGLAFAPDHGTELSVLLRRADIAMYQAKRAREGQRVYDDTDDTAGAGRLRAQQELHIALAEGQLTLHYQPKLKLSTHEVRDVEALVRWNHPTRGLLTPGSFLSLVEDAGLMRPMTQFVLAEALDQAAIWRQNGRAIKVAVNLSASSLVDTDLPAEIAELLKARGLPAGALQLEITEEFLMSDRDRTRAVLTQLRDQGIQISVDDFGTGYSSLAYLRELPIDELKLDRSFVFPMAADPRAAALVRSTILLAHSVGLRMVAEGVENQTTLTELAVHGCDQAQGYHIARALPAAELDRWLEQRDRPQHIPRPGPSELPAGEPRPPSGDPRPQAAGERTANGDDHPDLANTSSNNL